MLIPQSEPLVLALREVQARLPVGLQHVTLDSGYDWQTGALETLVLSLRAKVLAHELAPATVTVPVRRRVPTTVDIVRVLEKPATFWDAVKLHLRFGRVEWVTARYVEQITREIDVETEVEVIIDRELHFPEAEITLPEKLGRAVLWEGVRSE